jgi:hypothetical protein
MRQRVRPAPCGCKAAPDVSRPVARVPAQGNQAVLRRLAAGRPAKRQAAPPVVHDVLRGGGRPLDAGTRGVFEQHFQADLGAVRLHDNALAARSAQAVDAAAYAVGPHVVFDAGRLAPSRPEGMRLLAHELAHVVQAGPAGALPPTIAIGETDAPEERAASQAAAGLPAGLQPRAADTALRRQTPDDENKPPKPKPMFPLPIVDQFDPVPFVPTPGGSGPSPYDPPSKVTDPSGKGPSLEDIRGGYQTLFGKKPLNLGMNLNAKMPGCSQLQASGSTTAWPVYQTFEQYDLARKMFHSPLSKDPWPQLTPGEYEAAVAACPQPPKPIPKEPAPPKGDFPTSATKPGTALA